MSGQFFLSIVLPVQSQEASICRLVDEVASAAAKIARDWEVIVVDNCSTDQTVDLLKTHLSNDAVPNVQVFALAVETDHDSAAVVGLERCLGDFACILDARNDHVAELPSLIERVRDGFDLVVARNLQRRRASVPYRLAGKVFDLVYRLAHGAAFETDAASYRVLSRRAINHVLQAPHPAVQLRHVGVRTGFKSARLDYRHAPHLESKRLLRDGLDRGARMLVSTSRVPLRVATSLCVFGATANVIYSIYVLAVALLKDDVAPGWVTISLQQSGMFFLISVVLLVLSEYALSPSSRSAPDWGSVVAEEFNSPRMTRNERANVEQIAEMGDTRG
ncbi:glycosyltransferase [Pseudomarimonas arenosa]|uniref:Glycosyltransferase n=1 Tax=Pseudomarimonas arenosa TaxID=2774145 RepID=A0AAW3ZGB0_9GAMM|nr:glycosyltransferase [Pseudomarimonas arenosa]MBD8524888.1 glycosyltransferase [Pseudomarimonas arenosa]